MQLNLISLIHKFQLNLSEAFGSKHAVMVGGEKMPNRMRLICITLGVAMSISSPSFSADIDDGIKAYDKARPAERVASDEFAAGVDAYSRGDYTAAYAMFMKEAQKGNASAQYKTGFMLAEGRGVAKNDAEAVRWYKLAAEKGLSAAQYNLAVMYEEGKGTAQDPEAALKWYRKAAEKGLAAAQYNLGVMYGNGGAVEQNDEEAFKWFRLAAAQGLAPAQYNLGLMYANGLGVEQNDREAMKWFQLAAAQNDLKAACGLAMMYASGKGTLKDLAKAKQLAKKGFDAGEEICRLVWTQNHLGD